MVLRSDAYSLKENLMKPFGFKYLMDDEECYNKRLSRARKTVECAFGILFSKWRILAGTIKVDPKFADVIVCSIVSYIILS